MRAAVDTAATKTSMARGGALKKVPANAKGLKKLPTAVRNKMGYMSRGGKVTKKNKTK
jgi:hypothetical protein